MLCSLLMDRGDAILCEQYTYTHMVDSIVNLRGYRALPLAMDAFGIMPEVKSMLCCAFPGFEYLVLHTFLHRMLQHDAVMCLLVRTHDETSLQPLPSEVFSIMIAPSATLMHLCCHFAVAAVDAGSRGGSSTGGGLPPTPPAVHHPYRPESHR